MLCVDVDIQSSRGDEIEAIARLALADDLLARGNAELVEGLRKLLKSRRRKGRKDRIAA
jgi:hypothetical protein